MPAKQNVQDTHISPMVKSLHQSLISIGSMMNRPRNDERLIEADWGAPRDQLFPVDIVVEATDRQGLLRDLSELLTREKINVTAVNTQTRHHQARMAFTLEVESVAQLKRALQLARDIPGVFSADRR